MGGAIAKAGREERLKIAYNESVLVHHPHFLFHQKGDAMSELRDKRVLITGANGFLGSILAQRVASEGGQVIALVRSQGQTDTMIGQGFEAIRGDMTNRESLHRAVETADIVLHAAANFGKFQDQRDVNLNGTRTLAEECAFAGVQRMIYVSSMAVYGFGRRGVVTEEMTPVPATYDYSRTKYGGEVALREVALHTGLPFSIIRPGMIYGAGSTNWTLALFKHAKRAPVLFPGEGDGSAHPIYIDDVVDMILRMATDDRALGQVFNCTPDPAPTWREWLLGYARLAGGHQQWRAIPPFLAHMGAGLGMMFAPAGSGRRDLPEILEMFLSRVTFSTAKGRELLGWEQKISLAEGIERCIPYLRAQNLL